MKLLGYRFVAVASVLLIVAAVAVGQSRARIVMAPTCPSADDEVLLELSSPHIARTEVPFDKTFAANDDWLAQLVFRVTNKGKKPIAAIVITVGLLEAVDEELAANASYDYGLQFIRVHPLNARQPKSKLRTIVAPGKEIEITAEGAKPYGLRYMDAILGGSTKANNWSEFAAQVGPRFQKMEIMRADVWFTDGSNEDARLVVRSKCDGAEAPEAAKHDENVADVCVDCPPEAPPNSTGILNGRALKLAKPAYPVAARAAGASGLVVVRVLIDEEGKVISAHAVSGPPALHDVSVAAAKNSLFSPTLLSGTPVKLTGVIHYNFVAR
jgi:TonB family protein